MTLPRSLLAPRLALAALLALGPVMAQAQDVLATYSTDSGSLPPEYAWDVQVTIRADGKVTLRRCTGYETEGPACKTRTGKATQAQLDAILAAAADSGLATAPARELSDDAIPIGGGSTLGTVVLDGQTLPLIAWPAPQDAPRVAMVLEAIRAAIPERLRRRFLSGT